MPQRDRLKDGLPECNSFCTVPMVKCLVFFVFGTILFRDSHLLVLHVKAVLETTVNEQRVTVSLPYGSVMHLHICRHLSWRFQLEGR